MRGDVHEMRAALELRSAERRLQQARLGLITAVSDDETTVRMREFLAACGDHDRAMLAAQEASD